MLRSNCLTGEETTMKTLVRVVAGGQTGVDQAALSAALELYVACGGWCPPGRVCETGRIPDRFPVQETPHERSREKRKVPRSLRTEWNARDSDGTLVLFPRKLGPMDPGTLWTVNRAKHYHGDAHLLCCDPHDADSNDKILKWLEAYQIRTLNVGGPAESRCPGLEELCFGLLLEVFEAARADVVPKRGGTVQ
jgi:Circularly permutated YpsA SLOG family